MILLDASQDLWERRWFVLRRYVISIILKRRTTDAIILALTYMSTLIQMSLRSSA